MDQELVELTCPFCESRRGDLASLGSHLVRHLQLISNPSDHIPAGSVVEKLEYTRVYCWCGELFHLYDGGSRTRFARHVLAGVDKHVEALLQLSLLGGPFAD